MGKELERERAEAVEREWQGYDFEGNHVGETSGWERTTPGCEWTRPIFFTPREGEGSDSLCGHFTVVFVANDSAEVADAYASLNGNDIGHRPAPSTGPRR